MFVKIHQGISLYGSFTMRILSSLYRSEKATSGAYIWTNIHCCESSLAIEGVFQGPNPHYSCCDQLNSQVARGDCGQHPHCPS